MDQQGRGNSVTRGTAGENEPFFNVIGIALPSGYARSLLRSIVQHPTHLLSVQRRDASRRSRRAEYSRYTVAIVRRRGAILLASQRHSHARADVITERNSAQEVHAINPELLS